MIADEDVARTPSDHLRHFVLALAAE